MRCPHCLTSFHAAINFNDLGPDAQFFWRAAWQQCPACQKLVIFLQSSTPKEQSDARYRVLHEATLVYPKAIARKPLPEGIVPGKIAKDYREACLVLAESPKASAALSRRCLQTILREHAKVKPQDLSKEIDEVLAAKQLPNYLAEDIDAVRNHGNFAAHPIKSTSTGEIVDVEPGEAEWNLDVLRGPVRFLLRRPSRIEEEAGPPQPEARRCQETTVEETLKSDPKSHPSKENHPWE